MSMLPRWLIAPGVGLMVTAIVVANPSAPEKIVTEWKSDDPEIVATQRKMDTQQHELAQRMMYKEVMITDLLAGKCTLAEVSDEFLRMNRELPSALTVIRSKYPAKSDEELSALNVLDYVNERLTREKHDPACVVELHKQYFARFGQNVLEARTH
jgi:hypothetical protein